MTSWKVTALYSVCCILHSCIVTCSVSEMRICAQRITHIYQSSVRVRWCTHVRSIINLVIPSKAKVYFSPIHSSSGWWNKTKCVQGESKRRTANFKRNLNCFLDYFGELIYMTWKAILYNGLLWKNGNIWKSLYQDMSDWTLLPSKPLCPLLCIAMYTIWRLAMIYSVTSVK